MDRARRFAVAAVAAVVLAAAASGGARAATLDDRVYTVASRLMCPVCAGQTVAESDAAVARQMREVIRAKLEAGETPDAIVNFFVAQFGDGILAEPPRRGLGLLLYAGPAAGVAGGLAIALLLIRRWTPARPRAGASGPQAARTAGEPGPDDRVRLARELEARERF